MLQELRSVIVGGALIHKNHEGSKHEGQRIHPTIGDFRAMYWERRRIAMVPPKVIPQLPKPDVKNEEKIVMVPPKVTPQLPTSDVKVKEKIVKAEVVDEHIEKIQDLQTYKQHDDDISTLSFE
ncbi:hypothetical protein Tco_1204277 [Tanacetum coccineum]